MPETKKGFWRNFTWQRFAWIICVYFLLMIVVTFAFDYILDKQSVTGYFKLDNLLKKFISAVFVGFFLTIWIDPPQKKKS